MVAYVRRSETLRRYFKPLTNWSRDLAKTKRHYDVVGRVSRISASPLSSPLTTY